MMMNAKEVFQLLKAELILDVSPSEKDTMLYWILEDALKLSRSEVLAGKGVKADMTLLKKMIARLNEHEPLQYILGSAEFYGRNFGVNPAVLIPRPETEMIITLALKSTEHKKQQNILDVGTGSGILAVTLALEIPMTKVMATDISQSAIETASENAFRHRAQVEFHVHDILHDSLDFGPLDLVVSNPPYVTESEKKSMQKNVTGFEPHLALFVPDSDPLMFYDAIAQKVKSKLRPGGMLAVEINERFGKETAALFRHHSYSQVSILKDLQAKDRVVTAVAPK